MKYKKTLIAFIIILLMIIGNIFSINREKKGRPANDIIINYYDVDEIEEQNIQNSNTDNDFDFDLYAERDAGESKSIADIRSQNTTIA